jgi:hypothetical protein
MSKAQILQRKPDASLLYRQREALSARISWPTIARELQQITRVVRFWHTEENVGGGEGEGIRARFASRTIVGINFVNFCT